MRDRRRPPDLDLLLLADLDLRLGDRLREERLGDRLLGEGERRRLGDRERRRGEGERRRGDRDRFLGDGERRRRGEREVIGERLLRGERLLERWLRLLGDLDTLRFLGVLSRDRERALRLGDFALTTGGGLLLPIPNRNTLAGGVASRCTAGLRLLLPEFELLPDETERFLRGGLAFVRPLSSEAVESADASDGLLLDRTWRLGEASFGLV